MLVAYFLRKMYSSRNVDIHDKQQIQPMSIYRNIDVDKEKGPVNNTLCVQRESSPIKKNPYVCSAYKLRGQ